MTRHPYIYFASQPEVYESTLKQAMKQYPNASSFTVVATTTEGVFSFIPNHLTRFIPESAIQLSTIDYPRGVDPLTALKREADKLANNTPNHFVLDDIIACIMSKQMRITKFHTIADTIKLAEKYTPELVLLAESLHGQITEQFYTRLKKYIKEARKQIRSVDIAIDNKTDVVITLGGKPLESADVIWEWLHLTPEEADALSNAELQAKQKRLYTLSAAIEKLSWAINRTDFILPLAYQNCRQKIDEAKTRKRKGNTT